MNRNENTVRTRLVQVETVSGEIKQIRFIGFNSHPENWEVQNAMGYQDEKLGMYSHLAELLATEDFHHYHRFCEFLIEKYLKAEYGKK